MYNNFGKVVFLAKGVSRKSVFLYTHSDREDMSHNSVESEIRHCPVPEKSWLGFPHPKFCHVLMTNRVTSKKIINRCHLFWLEYCTKKNRKFNVIPLYDYVNCDYIFAGKKVLKFRIIFCLGQEVQLFYFGKFRYPITLIHSLLPF